MPWWSWALIWTVLVLVLLLVLVLGALYLWRKAKGLLGEASEAQEKLSAAYGGGVPLEAPAEAAGTVPVAWDAIFSTPEQVRAQRSADQELRVARRRKRRIDSLYAHGRPRRWGDVHDEGQ